MDEISTTDLRVVGFNIAAEVKSPSLRCNPRFINWELYTDELRCDLNKQIVAIETKDEIRKAYPLKVLHGKKVS